MFMAGEGNIFLSGLSLRRFGVRTGWAEELGHQKDYRGEFIHLGDGQKGR